MFGFVKALPLKYWNCLKFWAIESPDEYRCIFMSALAWCFAILMMIPALCLYLCLWLGYTAYRSVVYVYSDEEFWSTVASGGHNLGRVMHRYDVVTKDCFPGECDVDFVTERYGLSGVINDPDFHCAVMMSGSSFRVTLRIGRNRHGEIKYWRILDYSA